MWIVFISLVIHLILLLSVYDIYLKKTTVQSNQTYNSHFAPPARRVVLFVIDGLGSQTLFNYKSDFIVDVKHTIRNEFNTTFISQVVDNYGTWGISHTQVPSELRPCHVALLAGFNEAPNVFVPPLFKKTIYFDSVLNESRHTWIWGDQFDQTDLMETGILNKNHIEVISTNFQNTNWSHMDEKITNKVISFIQLANSNSHIQDNKLMFIITLGGIARAEHLHKPNAINKYLTAVKSMDTAVLKMVTLFNEFFADQKTAFILTALHGMTQWASETGSDPREVQTPLIAWGSGVKKPQWRDIQINVNQVDISVLIATLLGIPIPRNSVGVLPEKFLNLSKKHLSEAYYTNMMQIVAIFKNKQTEKEKNRDYESYKLLTTEILDTRLSLIEDLIIDEQYELVIDEEKKIIELSLAGLKYFSTYHQMALLATVTVAHVVWVIVILELILRDWLQETCTSEFFELPHGRVQCNQMCCFSSLKLLYLAFFGTAWFTFYIVYISKMESIYIEYWILPQILICLIVYRHKTWKLGIALLRKNTRSANAHLVLTGLIHLVFVEIMVLSFFIREILTVGVLGIGVWFLLHTQRSKLSSALLVQWVISTFILAIFPILPINGNYNKYTFILPIGCIIWIVISSWAMFYEPSKSEDIVILGLRLSLLKINFLLILIAIITTILVHVGEHSTPKIIPWCLSGISLITPLLSSPWIPARITHVVLSLLVPYLLLSTSYEPLFFASISFSMYTLWEMEYHRLNYSDNEKILDAELKQMRTDSTEVIFNGSGVYRGVLFTYAQC